ncbi:palindromic element RPE2 domain-containing protein [Candidatus Tisiphia endosymbiont of Mystacides longicornis]|uniref:palindromic element RPE2 domain-containing protein n=1 Tax=Candidatus Tisiphia endosymbiont of Mystacides longicornis TaxID=3139330 RepID=UPI003CCAD41D
MLLISDSSYFSSDYFVKHNFLLYIVNSGEFGARSDGATPISNRRATSDNIPNFSSIDYRIVKLSRIRTILLIPFIAIKIIRHIIMFSPCLHFISKISLAIVTILIKYNLH